MRDSGNANGLLFADDREWITSNPEETHALGKWLGENLRGGDVVALCGELGAGKTCLTQGIAAGLGVPKEYPVTSPTFTLINEYGGRMVLYHLDMYRLVDEGDLYDIGFESCFNDKGVVVIEWAEKVMKVLPEGTLFLLFTYMDEHKRKIVLTRCREHVNQLIRQEDGGL